MKTEEMICELRRLEEAHKDDFVGTGETNWSLMCHDVANRLEELLTAQEPRVMTLEEIKDYLDDPGGDKKPLWLEWHSIPALSGWVLASQVSDLMKRYMDSYNNTWRPWTSRPTDEQREATSWA